MDESTKKSNAVTQAKKSLETRQQHDSNVVDQLKVIVADKETKIKSLEIEVHRLQTLAVCRLAHDVRQHVVAVWNCQETVASRISIFWGENTFSHILCIGYMRSIAIQGTALD